MPRVAPRNHMSLGNVGQYFALTQIAGSPFLMGIGITFLGSLDFFCDSLFQEDFLQSQFSLNYQEAIIAASRLL
jgi:hypothetical protein